jgi:hypothetical protein
MLLKKGAAWRRGSAEIIIDGVHLELERYVVLLGCLMYVLTSVN